jgi:UDP-N-acetylglucosamine--N-acetylmuramyl-(pentapeptide) pyrophosphoryl-undecaprenol N-acetylglucosamine transferase
MQLNSNNLICLVAGQSAGHILPALTIAGQIKQAQPETQFLFFSNHTALDLKLLSHHPLINQHVPLHLPQIPYRAPWRLPRFAWQLLKTLAQVYKLLKRTRPKQIISTGGLVSVPVGVLGWWLKIPVIVYELNLHPGKAVQFLARFATQIKVCFAQTMHDLPKGKSELVDYPIRFTPQDYLLDHAQAFKLVQVELTIPKRHCEEQSDAANYLHDLVSVGGSQPSQINQFNNIFKTILILGGSQGSRSLNELVMGYVNQLPAGSQVQIIHQTGAQNCDLLKQFYTLKNIPALVFSYRENLMPYMICADLIICRAGAGTLAEVLPLRKPVIVIPLQTSYTSHQLENAQALAQTNSQLTVLIQSEIEATPQTLYSIITTLLI